MPLSIMWCTPADACQLRPAGAAELAAPALALGSAASAADLEAALGMPSLAKGSRIPATAHGRAANLRLVLAAALASVAWAPLDEAPTDICNLTPLLGSAQVRRAGGQHTGAACLAEWGAAAALLGQGIVILLAGTACS